MVNINSTIRKNGVIYGVVLGIVLLILGIFLYYYKTRFTESFFMIAVGGDYIQWLLRLGLAILFCYNLRKKIGGYWTVRQATAGIFVMFMVAYAIQFVGRDLLFEKVIDKNTVVNTHTAFTNASQRLFKEDGNAAKFNERQKKIDENYPMTQKNVSISETIMGFLMAVIFIFVISLLFAAGFKKELVYI
ncbi:MAG TPA: DUF4199 domain-containing protein [Mucilaginibacter sp.]|jgi:Ca2+/H+ antiporter|nr:DUF4199 domain-containing protein [Mucilaginibacter sp.]